MDKSIYINVNPVHVRLYKKADIDKYDKFEYITMNNFKDLKYKEVIIKFPTTPIFENKEEKNLNNVFRKKSIFEYVPDISKKDNVYTVKHMNLIPYMTIEEFKYLIASILKTDENNILNIYPTNENMEFVNEIDKERCKDFYWLHNNEVLPDYNAYQHTASIGYSSIIVNVIDDEREINVNYDFKFYPRYLKIIQYIENITKNTTINITKDIILSNADLQNVEVLLINGSADKNTITNINILKLFTSLHTSISLKKILINDSVLSVYNLENRDMQYIKTPSEIKDGFKNTFSRFNCCSIYVINEIIPGLVLSRLEVYKDGFIKCCFIINDPEIKIDTIKETMQDYFKREMVDGELKQTGKFWKLFSKLNIAECIYNFYYDDINFIPIYHNISYIIMLDNVKTRRFKEKFKIIDQEIPSLVYSTNTSVFLSAYSTMEAGGFYNFYYSRSFHSLVTDSTLKNDIMSHVHLQAQSDETLICYISKCYKDDDLILNASLVLPVFDYDFNKTDEDNDEFDKLPIEQKVKKIREKYKKLPTKKAIKKLNESDPVLFDNRYINEKEKRPYSALAQKKEQRVVVITKKEYDAIVEINKEYVSDIRNQTQGSQRLYLFCPFETFPFINFHHYRDQLCIPKCTTNITKRNQFTFCNNQLDAKNVTITETGDLSKMIIYYSPLLVPGRKCKPPEELGQVCENYILLKLDKETNIYDYCINKYDVKPFIITRDNINKQYYINTEITYTDEDYILVIQSELDNLYYLVLGENTYKPYLLSEHKETLTFFKSIQLNKNVGYTLFNYIDSVFNFGISKMYFNKTFTEIMFLLENVYKISFVTNENKTIIGIKKDNILLFTPSLEFDANSIKINTMPINSLINSCDFPKIDMFNPDLITQYFKDYESGEIRVINYDGVHVIIKPINENDLITMDSDIILFDYSAYVDKYRFAVGGHKKERNFMNYKSSSAIETLINLLIYIYFNTVDFDKFDKMEFIKLLKNIGIVNEKETLIEYTDKEKNNISWKNSTINEKDFLEIINRVHINNVSLVNTFYEELTSTLNIFKLKENEKITVKMITNNTF